jgi:AcrR family transcriptional regulator
MAADRGGIQRRRPRQSRSRATWDAILEAAAQVLERDGPGGFTTTSVAERAGVSIGTLYQYFPDKQAILLAAAERAVSGEAPPRAGRQEALMRALIALLESIGRMASSTPPTSVRLGRARTRLGEPGLERLVLDWDLDLAAVFRGLLEHLAPAAPLQPARARARRRL